MVRHIFIGVIKEGVSESKIDERLEVMKGLKEAVPFVKNFAVGRNLGWFTPIDSLVLTAVFENKEKWEDFINSDYHLQKLYNKYVNMGYKKFKDWFYQRVFENK